MLEVRVANGHGTGKTEVVRRCLQYVEKRSELKWVDGLV